MQDRPGGQERRVGLRPEANSQRSHVPGHYEGILANVEDRTSFDLQFLSLIYNLNV